MGSTSPLGYSSASKRSRTLNGSSPVTTTFMRPSSKVSVTSVTRAVQPTRRALPSSSRKTMPKGSSASTQWPIIRLYRSSKMWSGINSPGRITAGNSKIGTWKPPSPAMCRLYAARRAGRTNWRPDQGWAGSSGSLGSRR